MTDCACVEVCAALTATPRSLPFRHNTPHWQATKNVLDAARSAGASHFVLLSAICVQKPLLEFQRAKLKLEAELQVHLCVCVFFFLGGGGDCRHCCRENVTTR
jgi:nucleoside-diphosphate-sugar epimerase